VVFKLGHRCFIRSNPSRISSFWNVSFPARIELQQDGPIFHVDWMRVPSSIGERVINGWHAPLLGEDFGLDGFAHFTRRATNRSCCHEFLISNFSIHSSMAFSAVGAAIRPRIAAGVLLIREISQTCSFGWAGFLAMTVSAAHAGASGHRAPIWPHVGADEAACGADHAVVEIEQRGVVGKPVEGQRGAVIAPGRGAVDQ
jgi:hypothetical protein